MTWPKTIVASVSILGGTFWMLQPKGPHAGIESYRGGFTIQADRVDVQFSSESEALIMMLLAQEAQETFEQLARPREE